MKKKILLLLISFLTIFMLSCMDATETADSASDSTTGSSVTLPGVDGILKSASSSAATQEYSYTYKECVYIQSPGVEEPVTIAANILIPEAITDGQKFPAIIFANSWALEEHEYIA